MSGRLNVELSQSNNGVKIWPKNLMLASHRERHEEKKAGDWGEGERRELYRVFLHLGFCFYKSRCTSNQFGACVLNVENPKDQLEI